MIIICLIRQITHEALDIAEYQGSPLSYSLECDPIDKENNKRNELGGEVWKGALSCLRWALLQASEAWCLQPKRPWTLQVLLHPPNLQLLDVALVPLHLRLPLFGDSRPQIKFHCQAHFVSYHSGYLLVWCGYLSLSQILLNDKDIIQVRVTVLLEGGSPNSTGHRPPHILYNLGWRYQVLQAFQVLQRTPAHILRRYHQEIILGSLLSLQRHHCVYQSLRLCDKHFRFNGKSVLLISTWLLTRPVHIKLPNIYQGHLRDIHIIILWFIPW